MSSSWPVGVTTQEDMHRYAKTLFGDCKIENLLTGMPFDAYPGCFLIRVKGACNQGDWEKWPDLIDEAMKATVDTYGRYPLIGPAGMAWTGRLPFRSLDQGPPRT